jgi:peptidoglycan/xylan/chitin deacetylase (PgdA/CDA1 family)
MARFIFDFFTRFSNRWGRELAGRFQKRLTDVDLKSAIISFTFDDFPKSALLNGGRILGKRDISGTFYTSFGLMGKTAPTGEIFSRDDLGEFFRQGHELACHTFDHCHSWETTPAAFEASILRNQKAAGELLPGKRMMNFSYPISHPRPQTKRRTARHYVSARGGGQTFNVGKTDLNYLKAFFIEQSRNNFHFIEQTIQANARANGWLIFATHDVCDSPTRFGCTPALFERIVDESIKSGAAILPVAAALRKIGVPESRFVRNELPESAP